MLWRVFGGGVGDAVYYKRLGKQLKIESLRVFIEHINQNHHEQMPYDLNKF